jgi:nucleotide-binding universal stress UspA family protein
MVHRIMVPLDGSAFAEAALPTALHLARRDAAAVQLVMVEEVPLTIEHGGGVPARDPGLDQDRHRQARHYLDTLLGRIDASDRVRCSTALMDGPIAPTLGARARDTGADLVVMTTHARRGMSRAWSGSVAGGLVPLSPAPVLLLRPEGAEGPGDETGVTFRRVLLPLDGSATGDRMIEHAIAVAGIAGVEYTLLRVIAAAESPVRAALPHRGEPPSSRTQRATVEARLDAAAAALRARGATARAKVVIDDRAADGILDYADEHGTTLIAMTTRSRGGLERALLGSVADTVLRSGDLPVLLWHPGRIDAAESSSSVQGR